MAKEYWTVNEVIEIIAIDEDLITALEREEIICPACTEGQSAKRFSAGDMDRLRLINGKLIKFNEYYKICEQCHRKVYRKWKMGVHGKRTGYWNGKKEHMHCAQCHDPHNPPFKPLKPMPAPRTPLKVRVMSQKGK